MRSVAPESGPQGEGGVVRAIWIRKGKFCARLGIALVGRCSARCVQARSVGPESGPQDDEGG